MPMKNGRLILERQVSDFAERFTVDPNNLLSIGTAVRATTGTYEIAVCGSDDNNYIGVIYSLDQTSYPYVALMGRCIVKVRGSVTKGNRLALNSYNGFMSQTSSTGTGHVRAIALTSQSDQHGQVEAVLIPGANS